VTPNLQPERGTVYVQKNRKAVKELDKNQHMGVESVSSLLYDLVRCSHSEKILEVGAGYSSIFLLKALADNLTDFEKEKVMLKGVPRVDEYSKLRRIL